MGKITFSIYIVYLLTFTFIVGLFSYFFRDFTGIDTFNRIQQVFLLYFVFLSGFVFYVIRLVNRGDGKSFISLFILSIVIKLILTIILCGVVVYLFPENTNVNVLLILVYYIIYTSFQLYFIKKLIDQRTAENAAK